MMFPPHLVIPIPSAVINAAVSGMHLVTTTRYLGAAGLVALLYDHSLTFDDEINLICTAPRSFLKWFFLTNHYMVEVCLIAVTSEMSGFGSLIHDDQVSTSCQKFLIAIACYAIISTFVTNLLGFLRVIVLWDKSPRIVLGLSIALIMTFFATVACTVTSIFFFEHTVTYDPSLNLCYITKSTKPFIVLWATPLAFDAAVLALITYNSLSNPRDLDTTLRRILYRDGIMFFLLVALIRVVNVVFVIAAEPNLASLPAYFSWAVITMACRRLFIHIHLCEQNAAYYDDLHASRPNSTHTDSESAIELRNYKTNRH